MHKFKIFVQMFNTIKNHSKKRFIINIMYLKKIYEKREIIEIKKINKKNNSVDIMIKKIFCNILKRFINMNIIIVKTSK